MGKYSKEYTKQNEFNKKIILLLEENGFAEVKNSFDGYLKYPIKRILVDKKTYMVVVFINTGDNIDVNCFGLDLNGNRDESVLEVSFIIDQINHGNDNSLNILREVISKIESAVLIVTKKTKLHFPDVSEIVLWSRKNDEIYSFASYNADDLMFDFSQI
jgi:hypothetical protein